MREDTGIQSLRNEFNRLFDRFWSGQFEPMQIGRWVPAVDVSETDTAVLVRAEVPGIDPADIEISVEADLLTIKGHKRERREDDEKDYCRAERQYGAFARTIQLPASVLSQKAEAVAHNGVLTVRLPKSEDRKPRKVTVTVE